MTDIPEDALKVIRSAMKEIDYGKIEVNLSEAGDYIEIVTSEKVRVPKENNPKAGRIVYRKKIRNDA